MQKAIAAPRTELDTACSASCSNSQRTAHELPASIVVRSRIFVCLLAQTRYKQRTHHADASRAELLIHCRGVMHAVAC